MLPYVQSLTPDDGRKDRPETCRVLLKINKFVKQVHLVGLTIGIYYIAQTHESQIYFNLIVPQHFHLNFIQGHRPMKKTRILHIM